MGGEGDLSFPTKMISLMGHCHGESCALYSRLRCGIGVSQGRCHGVTGPRVHARQLRTGILSFFLWF